MSAGDTLRAGESSALYNNQIISSVSGKSEKKKKGKLLSWSAAGMVFVMIFIVMYFVNFGGFVPDNFTTRVTEQTDMQHADGVASKIVVFAQALKDILVPENTKIRLAQNEVLVEERDGEAVLNYHGRIITGNDFQEEVMSDAGLYDAFDKSTYSMAAYYYDNSANEVFKQIGTSRNNYTDDTSFEEVMSRVMGEGSDINVNNVALYEWEDEETGELMQEYEEVGETGNSENAAAEFIESVRSKNVAASREEATMNAADALNTADTIAKEQRSSLFFLTFVENISKMKAGDGNESKINEAMNYLFNETESSVVDVETGEIITSYGSMTESPSLYAILTGERLKTDGLNNYSNERILKTVENQIGVGGASRETLEGTITSTNTKTRGSIGRFLDFWGEEASGESLEKVSATIQSSLVDNSFDTIGGIRGGEMLVEGAVNVGKELAKASGATAGDASAVESYAKLTNTVLAMEAKVDRMNRSPFDITSRNTFLGSIFYDFAINIHRGGIFSNIATFAKVTSSAVASLSPSTLADDEKSLYLTNYGECEKIGNIGAVGSVGCSMIATFDTSTLEGIFEDAGFIAFMDENTTLDSSGTRTINNNSKLADFIKYNAKRITPIGTTDGGILESLVNGSGFNIPFLSDILSMIKMSLEATEEDKRIATGEAFVNSGSNADWDTYKYAQRYMSLARATEALRQYDGEATAYSNLKYFEGTENPVIAFLRENNLLADN